MTLESRLVAVVTAIGEAVKSVRDDKADDDAVVKLSGAQTVAGVKTFSSAPLVAAGTNAANPIRYDDVSRTNARTPTAHTHTPTVSAGSVSTSVATDASVGDGLWDLTVTGAAVAVAAPTNPTSRRVIEYGFYASVASTVTFNSSIRLSTGLSSRAFPVGAAGQVLFATLQYSSLLGAWVLLAAAVSVT